MSPMEEESQTWQFWLKLSRVHLFHGYCLDFPDHFHSFTNPKYKLTHFNYLNHSFKTAYKVGSEYQMSKEEALVYLPLDAKLDHSLVLFEN